MQTKWILSGKEYRSRWIGVNGCCEILELKYVRESFEHILLINNVTLFYTNEAIINYG